jgi:hypothetical protein
LKDYLDAKNRGVRFTFEQLDPLYEEVTPNTTLNQSDKVKELEDQRISRVGFREALLGSYVLPGE